jgi:hypothetical protein
MVRYFLISFFLMTAATFAADGGKAKCVGGTNALVARGTTGRIQTSDSTSFILTAEGKTLKIPYAKINLVEYGQNVSRRIALAILISPMFLLAKSREHFVTLGYTDEKGQQQAIVLQVQKQTIRSTLTTLEVRTGRTVRCQDDEARKFHQG